MAAHTHTVCAQLGMMFGKTSSYFRYVYMTTISTWLMFKPYIVMVKITLRGKPISTALAQYVSR